MENKPTTFDFSVALNLLKDGKKVSRLQFRDTCHVEAQYPTELSKMTKPYLIMVKKTKVSENTAIDIFPVDLSCESLFADDWYEITN